MNDLTDMLIVADNLCTKLLDKEYWDCQKDAEKLRQMIISHRTRIQKFIDAVVVLENGEPDEN